MASTPAVLHSLRDLWRRGPAVRRVGASDLDWALAQGWRDFLERRGDIVVIALVYPVVGVAAAALALNQRLWLPMFFPLVAGLSILGPAVASGFYEIDRRRAAGLEASWRHFLDPLSDRRAGPLAALTAGLLVLFALWLLAAYGVFQATLGATGPLGAADFFRRLFSTPQGWTLMVAGNAIGFVFAFITLILALVSFPLVVDTGAGPLTAVETSLAAARANPRQTALWGLRVGVLLVLGCIPAFVGLAVILPVLGYASWRLYTRLVER